MPTYLKYKYVIFFFLESRPDPFFLAEPETGPGKKFGSSSLIISVGLDWKLMDETYG